MPYRLEKDFQDLIASNSNIQKDICSVLEMDYKDFKLLREDTYINGIIADFTLFEKNKVRAIIECKGGAIGVSEYVRGIGQIFQYEYFFENHLSLKNYGFCQNFNSVLIFPKSVLKNNDFNVGLFKYPKSKKILEINSHNLAVRHINDNELEKLRETKHRDFKVISPYYVRDIRFFEVYFLLQVLAIFKFKNKLAHRKNIEETILKKTNSLNNGNWHNVFITLSTLGFIDSQNYPTSIGLNFVNMSYSEFLVMVFESYIKPYYIEIFKLVENDTLNLKNNEIAERIKMNFNNHEVLFLTESNSRYISSWLNITKDDFAFFDFTKRLVQRQLVFNPFTSNKENFMKHIEKYSLYNKYKERYKEILNDI
ncbi:hypothetical protein HpCHN105_03260 [Helicobacter pylori]